MALAPAKKQFFAVRGASPSAGGRSRHALRVGFVPLIDAAPLIVAAELGYFADEGLDVGLEKQIGWGNVRDRLTYGELDASHAPLGMAPASAAGLEFYDQKIVVLLGLMAGGNAITVRPDLAALGVGRLAPGKWRHHLGRPVNLAYVFSVASHNYVLRDFLHQAGVRLSSDANLCVMPPTQMPQMLRQGVIDGYCAGEPWNTLAVEQGYGTVIRATTELTPDHPEKALAVTAKWYEQHPLNAERLVRATLRGCDFCDAIASRSRLTEILARPSYLAMDENVIHRSLSIDDWLRPNIHRPQFRSFARDATVPSVAAMEWILTQMIRWGHLPQHTDIARLAAESIAPAAYARALQYLGGRVQLKTKQSAAAK